MTDDEKRRVTTKVEKHCQTGTKRSLVKICYLHQEKANIGEEIANLGGGLANLGEEIENLGGQVELERNIQSK